MSYLDYSLPEIKQRGGWASSTVLKYTDMPDYHAVELDKKKLQLVCLRLFGRFGVLSQHITIY